MWDRHVNAAGFDNQSIIESYFVRIIPTFCIHATPVDRVTSFHEICQKNVDIPQHKVVQSSPQKRMNGNHVLVM